MPIPQVLGQQEVPGDSLGHRCGAERFRVDKGVDLTLLQGMDHVLHVNDLDRYLFALSKIVARQQLHGNQVMKQEVAVDADGFAF